MLSVTFPKSPNLCELQGPHLSVGIVTPTRDPELGCRENPVRAAALSRGQGALLGILGWEKLLGAPPDSKMRTGKGGEGAKKFCSSMGFTQA